MIEFVLDEQLAKDTLYIGDLGLCRVLRMNDVNYPWLVMVPRRPGARDIIDLEASDQVILWTEVGHVARLLRDHTGAYKLNVAALGNVVAQLHVHVIGRQIRDAAWPKPVWGAVPPVPFAPEDAEREAAQWRRLLV